MRSARMSSATLWSLEATAVSSAHALPSPLPAALVDRGANACFIRATASAERTRKADMSAAAVLGAPCRAASLASAN
jgi:hypothetical protein